MRLVELISSTIDERFGTTVMKQQSACEIIVPSDVFRLYATDGYCIPREVVADFITTVLASPGGNTRQIKAACSMIAKADIKSDDSIRHIIVLSDKLDMLTAGITERIVLHRSLTNHERFHSITMMRPEAWAERLSDLMFSIDSMSGHWATASEALMDISAYKNMLSVYTREWIIGTELIARTAAVNHAPEKHRETVATYQLRHAKNELMQLSSEIRNRWRTSEGVVGWCDAIYYGKRVSDAVQLHTL